MGVRPPAQALSCIGVADPAHRTVSADCISIYPSQTQAGTGLCLSRNFQTENEKCQNKRPHRKLCVRNVQQNPSKLAELTVTQMELTAHKTWVWQYVQSTPTWHAVLMSAEWSEWSTVSISFHPDLRVQ